VKGKRKIQQESFKATQRKKHELGADGGQVRRNELPCVNYMRGRETEYSQVTLAESLKYR